jgi:hypothetical protein
LKRTGLNVRVAVLQAQARRVIARLEQRVRSEGVNDAKELRLRRVMRDVLVAEVVAAVVVVSRTCSRRHLRLRWPT